MTFAVRLVDAQFPPYSQVIPQQSEKLVRVPRAAFSEALRAVSVAASERTGGVKLGLTKGTMRITTESPDSGEGFDEVPIEYAGPNMTVGFNAKYFLDVLGALDEDEVELGFGGELDPAVVKPVGPAAVSRRRDADANLIAMRSLAIGSLSIRDFRNLARVDVDLGPRFNVIFGDNGQGKTNLLEAVYVLATSRSFRTLDASTSSSRPARRRPASEGASSRPAKSASRA